MFSTQSKSRLTPQPSPIWTAPNSPPVFQLSQDTCLKSEAQVDPVPANPEKVPFFFEKPQTGKSGHGQSQCDKCGWNFDNESFLQVSCWRERLRIAISSVRFRNCMFGSHELISFWHFGHFSVAGPVSEPMTSWSNTAITEPPAQIQNSLFRVHLKNLLFCDLRAKNKSHKSGSAVILNPRHRVTMPR